MTVQLYTQEYLVMVTRDVLPIVLNLTIWTLIVVVIHIELVYCVLMVCCILSYHKVTLIHLVGCVENTLRLVGGSTELEGTIEVCINSVWGLIGDAGWNEADADVVCRQLGLPTGGVLRVHLLHSKYYCDDV